jgi:predicted membrane protein
MKRSAASGIVFGVFVILFGLLVLSKGILGWNIGISFVGFWALVIVAASIVSIVHRGFRFWNVVFLVIGGWIFIDQLGFWGRHTFLSLVAILLIAFGIFTIVNAVSHSHYYGNCGNYDGEHVNEDSNDYVKYESSFCETKVANVSKSFKGGKVSIAFGRMCLDLSQIEIQGEAMIDVSSTFAALEIILPRNMPYKTGVSPVFGSFINNAPTVPAIPGQPFLEIKGSAVFGTCKLS